MTNSEIRNNIKKLRNALEKEEVLRLSNAVFNNVLSLELNAYKNFFIYRSFNNEVDTNRLINHFLNENKVISFPVITGENMVAGEPLSDRETLSMFKTVEPSCYEEVKNVDVCFLPLLACDKNKNRLGYGKGYYDRFLASHPCLKIGLAYSFQVVEGIERKPWDIPLDIIVTDTQIIK